MIFILRNASDDDKKQYPVFTNVGVLFLEGITGQFDTGYGEYLSFG